jgi:hypothetical protein
MFKKIALATVAASLLLGSAVNAAPMIGQKLSVTNSYGQPFCLDTDDLKEFLIAAMTKDNEAVGAILKDGRCTMLKKGTAISVLEDIGEVDEEMHGIKVRAIGKNSTSVIGYTLSIGMTKR